MKDKGETKHIRNISCHWHKKNINCKTILATNYSLQDFQALRAPWMIRKLSFFFVFWTTNKVRCIFTHTHLYCLLPLFFCIFFWTSNPKIQVENLCANRSHIKGLHNLPSETRECSSNASWYSVPLTKTHSHFHELLGISVEKFLYLTCNCIYFSPDLAHALTTSHTY